MAGLNELAQECHEIAKSKGWYDTAREVPELLMLCVSELAEALEDYRTNDFWRDGTWLDGSKPAGVGVELADCIIRILDMVAYLGIDIDLALQTKMEYNRGRPYRHGGKRV